MIPGALHPRHRIDIEPEALARALGACVSASADSVSALEALACPAGEVIATLSARSAFDLLLSALALPAGSEVILSAWTIPDMARIVRAHGLVPVPLDCRADTLAPELQALRDAISPRIRVAVIAQLFGARAELAGFDALCRARGVLLIDDDAQGFVSLARLREGSCADVTLHSFGSIKTATALGGGLVRVRDEALRARMRQGMAAWPMQSRGRYARKVGSYLGLSALREPSRYGAFAHAVERRGDSLDGVITAAVKGFPSDSPEALLRAIRSRPCDALCATMREAIAGCDPARVSRRREAGERLRARLEGVEVLGDAMPERTHWLFAVLSRSPASLVAALRRAGFDGARGTSTITALEPSPERPEMRAVTCERWPPRMVFLPAYPEIPESERDRMAEVVRSHER